VAYHVQCEAFQGPLDLLVSLAYRGQIDLQKLPLRRLAEAYLAVAPGEGEGGGAAGAKERELDEATEALVHLAVLSDLKARTLVPKAPPAETPPPAEETASALSDRLGAQMAEYVQFREAAQALRALEQVQSRIFAHPPDAAEPGDDVLLQGVTLEDLFTAFSEVLQRAREAPREIAGEEFTVGQKMDAVVAALEHAGGAVDFGTLFREGASRLEIIVTFLALLELIRQRRIRARQPRVFGAIEISLVAGS
jgi:segregation and condensation protein A